MIDTKLMSKIEALTPTQRLEFIKLVWATVDAKDVPVTAGERSLLDARIADAQTNPRDESPWADVRERLKQQLP